jgi:hypothetical protein
VKVPNSISDVKSSRSRRCEYCGQALYNADSRTPAVEANTPNFGTVNAPPTRGEGSER